jgi:hypothetical protein
MANVVVSALATWNGKALKKAKQDVSTFDKQLKNFAKSVGVAFSATAIISFSKKAVKAFAEDEVAAKSLQLQLENTGNAFRVTEVENYIKSLEKTYAILTDLRAPFQTLLNVTGSVDLAQRSLEAALDISAGTGQSLATVIGAISAGARGQTKAIRGLNTGIDESILATGDMNKIMEELEKRFSGQAAARLGTYAGKMDAFKKSSDEASKIIGEGLVDALTILSQDNTIENLSNDMEDFATAIADTVRGIAILTNKIKKLPGLDKLLTLEAIPVVGSYLEAFRNMGAQSRNAQGGSNFTYGSGNPRADLLISKNLTKARKEEFKIINQKNAIENKNVEELKKKFDLERIGITQALNVATDDETKTRLKAQLAILDNNEAMAKKLLAELEAYEALKKLADAANKASEALTTQFDLLSVAVKNLLLSLGVSPNQVGPGGVITGTAGGGRMGSLADVAINNPEFGYSNEARALGLALGFTPGISMGGSGQEMRVTVDVSGAGDKLSQAIAESIQVATRNGYSTVPAGQGF